MKFDIQKKWLVIACHLTHALRAVRGDELLTKFDPSDVATKPDGEVRSPIYVRGVKRNEYTI